MASPATATRAVLAAAALACGGVLLAACGSSGGSAAAPTTVTATATATAPASTSAPPATGSSISPHAGPPACATSGLSVKLGAGNGAAGSTFIPIVFTNTTGSACSLFGYPGVSFVTGQGGSQIGSAAMRDPTQPARSIVVAAGGVAHAVLRVGQADNFPAAGCKPTAVSTLKIFPPGQTDALYLAFSSRTCASTSPADQVLYIQTIGSGNGNG
ncbi:MAG TPA: DUF4232 domain-containing protein [Streptosporangiaceae bacterium]|nr:DUF4232 domain-containing protein [Streptosporangiaceae bacterium]